jgi:hypothetical protein
VLLAVSRLGLRDLKGPCDEMVASSNEEWLFALLVVDVREVSFECVEMGCCCVELVVAVQALEGGRSNVCGRRACTRFKCEFWY